MKKVNYILASLIAMPVFAFHVHAQNFGESWRSLSPVSTEQTRVVYYRSAAETQNGPANIYVDGEFHTSLLPGGFTVFCLAPGIHSLGSYVKDAPHYQGKQAQAWRDKLGAGRTYYIRASLDTTGRPLVTAQGDAEQALSGLRQQKHLLSRASSVQQCQAGSAVVYDNYAFSGDLLFRFSRAADSDLSSSGREAIAQFAAMLKQKNATDKKIVVTGFTDPIGDEKANMRLGQRRADTVKDMLVRSGIPATNITTQSMGESRVTQQCSGPVAQQIQCYAHERRVIISVEAK